jgi:hypothetical protein
LVPDRLMAFCTYTVSTECATLESTAPVDGG